MRWLLLAILCVRCSTMAVVTTKDQEEFLATITGSDTEKIHLMTNDGPRKIDRSRVSEISHPGKFHMLLGGALIVGGIITFIAIDQRQCRENCVQPATGIGLPIISSAIGTGIFFWGYSTWSDSRSAFAPPAQSAFPLSGGQLGLQFRF